MLSPDEPFTVTELTRQIKNALEGNFPACAVRGEVSGLTRPSSGHLYFTLKDEGAQLRSVMWRSKASKLRFEVESGTELIAIGAIDLYPPRGAYQLLCDQLLPIGLGPLELAFRQLHDRLRSEGLFEAERKKDIPAMPSRVALVTSPTGAAVRDMLQVLNRRWPLAQIVIAPARVQGEGSAAEIAKRLKEVDALGCDVIICGRGGGSLEDLWAFNEEVVARAIAACRTPIVSAVGHEIDVTIADLVADVRALTPSEAAERIVPSSRDIFAGLAGAENRLTSELLSRIAQSQSLLDRLQERRPFARPLDRITTFAADVDQLARSIERAAKATTGSKSQELFAASSQLEALSPLAVLNRGYSLTQTTGGEVVRTSNQLSEGDTINTRLASGNIVSEVKAVRPASEEKNSLL